MTEESKQLYDALLEAAKLRYEYCLYIQAEVAPPDDIVSEGCPEDCQRCPCSAWWKVLRKVQEANG